MIRDSLANLSLNNFSSIKVGFIIGDNGHFNRDVRCDFSFSHLPSTLEGEASVAQVLYEAQT